MADIEDIRLVAAVVAVGVTTAVAGKKFTIIRTLDIKISLIPTGSPPKSEGARPNKLTSSPIFNR